MKGRMIIRNEVEGDFFYEVEGEAAVIPHFEINEVFVHHNPLYSVLSAYDQPVFCVSHASTGFKLAGGDTPEDAIALATGLALSVSFTECRAMVEKKRAISEAITVTRIPLTEAEIVARDLWVIFVPGPDDVFAAPSRQAAESLVAHHNRRIAASDFDADVIACVTAQIVPWPYSPESHAEALKDWPKTVEDFTPRNASTETVPA